MSGDQSGAGERPVTGDQAESAVNPYQHRELDLVELVDAAGRPAGSATVAQAHSTPGRLHRAFSVMLRDRDGRLLLQQRAAVKTRFPLRWANSCCGHPAPGADLASAAARRLNEELGITGVRLVPVGAFTYQATDPQTGRVEYEYDHVLVGDTHAPVTAAPDPGEVAALRWADPEELRASVRADPDRYAPWLEKVLRVLAE